jgi:glycosyltransferase involved in cell wall biosynthesis
LLSIESQTYKGDIRIYVLDDCSTKNSVIREQLSPYVHFQANLTNMGPSYCRNLMATIATEAGAKYLAFLDADDIYAPQKIEKSVEIMEREENVAAVYSDYTSLNMKTGVATREYKPAFDKHYLLRECIVNNDSVVRASAFKAVGGYDEEMRCAEDYDLWIRISHKWLIYHIPEDLVTVRVTGEGATFSRTSEEWQRNWNRIREKLNATAIR